MSNAPRVVEKDYVEERITARLEVAQIFKKAKGDIMKEFEKVCPTDRSFDRVLKEVHNIFDEMKREMEERN